MNAEFAGLLLKVVGVLALIGWAPVLLVLTYWVLITPTRVANRPVWLLAVWALPLIGAICWAFAREPREETPDSVAL